jgi:hypothetical protein
MQTHYNARSALVLATGAIIEGEHVYSREEYLGAKRIIALE